MPVTPFSSVRRGRPIALCVTLVVTALSACSHDGREMRPPLADQNDSVISIPEPTEAPVGFDTAALDDEAPSGFTVSAPWVDGGSIPIQYTCNGGDLAPVISWSGAPDTTASLAVVLIDTTLTDESGIGFVHWVVYNIDPSTTDLDAATLPVGAVAAPNGFSTADATVTSWRGPCPPLGQPHTYVLEVHALDQMLDALDGAPTLDVIQAIDAATIETASVTASAVGM